MQRRWPDLYERASTLLRARERLAQVAVRRRSEIRKRPPGETIALRLVAAPKGDGWEGMLLQVDVWAPSVSALAELIQEVSAALDRHGEVEMGGLRFCSTYDDGRDHDDDEEAAAHHSLDFRMEAVWKR